MILRSTSSWKWELIATTGSFALLLAIIVILASYDGRTVFNWHSITLNAIISILSTSSKAALLFTVGECVSQWKWILFARSSRPLVDLERIDAASRSPLGSAVLLWPRYQISLLRLGAIITILALALDPFAQQLIRVVPRITYTETTSTTINYARRYSLGTRVIPMATSYRYANVTAYPAFPMQAAILSGLVQSVGNLTRQTTFNCPTSDCQWKPVRSLAVCSSCNNLNDRLMRIDTRQDLRQSIVSSLNPGVQCDNQTWFTSFTLPNGLFINNKNGQNPLSVRMTTFGTGDPHKTVSLQESDSLIWAMTTIRVGENSSSTQAWPDWPLDATECGLHFCVKEYNPSFMNGTLIEGESEMSMRRNANSWQVTKGSLGDMNLTEQLAIPTSLEFDQHYALLERTDLVLGNEFNVSQDAINGIGSYFQNIMRTTLTLRPYSWECGEATHASDNNSTLNNITGWWASQITSPPSMEALYSSTNFSATFEALAKSMSNSIRTNADANATWVGSSGMTNVVYSIVWPWMALHVLLVMCGILLLLWTIYECNSREIPTWKSSSLAPLSLPAEVCSILTGVETVSQMEKTAAQHFVRLQAHHRSYSGFGQHTVRLVDEPKW